MMIPPVNNENLENGFCCGTYPVSVDSGPRIRFRKKTVEVLKKQKVKQLWQYLDPTGPRVILCPPQYRSIYVETAKQHLPKSMDFETALRRFIFSGDQIPLNSQGRIPILETCQEHLKVKATDTVFIVGLGLWFEVRREADMPTGSGHCEE
jgi:DNA-binding transcriptional regulator/RsmH inhibitor MraZ